MQEFTTVREILGKINDAIDAVEEVKMILFKLDPDAVVGEHETGSLTNCDDPDNCSTLNLNLAVIKDFHLQPNGGACWPQFRNIIIKQFIDPIRKTENELRNMKAVLKRVNPNVPLRYKSEANR